ncbi:MAG: hypothetical protein KAV00_07590 [Phycisphaerae bacterium]|nr:hypothetical protein [Phycisphaerae bacterium]
MKTQIARYRRRTDRESKGSQTHRRQVVLNVHRYVRSTIRTVTLAVILLSIAEIAPAQDPVLEVRVMDTTAESGSQNVSISIYMKNFADTVAGFALWLQLDRADLMSLHLEVDTVNTLISGWEYVESRYGSSEPHNLRIVGLADFPGPPITPSIAPQNGPLPLVRIRADIANILDTTTDRTVQMVFALAIKNFAFSDPYGQVIGTVRDSVPNTAYYACQAWEGNTCLEWELVEGPLEPFDSMFVYWDYFSYYDWDRVLVHDGSLTVTGGYVCADLNNDFFPADISDLVFLVDYMFLGGPPPLPLQAADCDGNGQIDISDLVYLVEFMFIDGPRPVCGA